MSITVENLHFSVDEHELLDDVSFTAAAGQVTALVGPNGAGKSTLLAAIAGDLDINSGQILIAGEDVSQLNSRQLARRRAVLTQHHPIGVPFTAEEVLDFGRHPWSTPDPQLRQEVIATCEIEHLLPRVVPTLSGGERARVHCARVFYQDTPVVLLDEPTAALDLAHAEDFLKAMRRLADEGKTVVVVLHDLAAAAAYADHIVVLSSGCVFAQGAPTEVLSSGLISAIYNADVEILQDSAGNPVALPRRRTNPSSLKNL
ncbi:MAG: heme ABC transporter ATP-binding protein [Corynebacterium urealyticum]|uniref:Heme ABC transporter ATP-binding protein n=1 Tax=Corynebacterium urealyticum TaxID=43771 RepID=A0A2W5CVJ6_9CORY|nr:MAG: heme ABC transporter ATP-binding protein [Corynebacterium urealyticum]